MKIIKISTFDFISTFLGFGYLLLIWAIPAGIIAVYPASWLGERWDIGFAIFVVLTLGFHFFYVKWMLNKVVINTAFYSDSVRSIMKKPDYINSDVAGGIGVDVTNKQIGIVTGAGTTVRTSKLFNLSGLKDYHSAEVGRMVHSGNMAAANNFAEAGKQARGTGLTLDFDDLDHPRVFIQMELSQANSWVLVLDKFRDGTLPALNAPRIYPDPAI